MTNLPDLDWKDVIPYSKYRGKSVKSVIDKDGKDAVIYLLKNEIPLTDEIINTFGIHRQIRDVNYISCIVDPFERFAQRDKKVYKKDTASREKILKEILTLEQDEPEPKYKNNKDDVDLAEAAETVIDESIKEYNG